MLTNIVGCIAGRLQSVLCEGLLGKPKVCQLENSTVIWNIILYQYDKLGVWTASNLSSDKLSTDLTLLGFRVLSYWKTDCTDENQMSLQWKVYNNAVNKSYLTEL